MPSTRINKLIAHSGLASRRQADVWVDAGRVTVDGEVARPGQQVDPDVSVVAVDGVPVPVKPGLAYWLVNKPEGVVSTVSDPQGRPTVVDLVPAEPRVYPVGRLDRDSAGLLILTNDGELTLRLTHPRFGVSKTYTALVETEPSRQTLRRLVDGVELDDGLARARSARVLTTGENGSLLEIVMTEGRNREVRRMLEAVGHPVKALFRTAIGQIRDPSLRAGEHRPLDATEVRALYEASHDA